MVKSVVKRGKVFLFDKLKTMYYIYRKINKMKKLILILAVLITVSCNKEPMKEYAFTPNGDGINDYLELPYLNPKLVVFNRNNVILYKSDSYQNDWDADGVANGLYYCIINDKIYGSIIILR